MGNTTVNKITVRTVYGKVPTIPHEVVDPVTKEKSTIIVLPDEVHLMRVYGQATGFRIASSQFGESAVFKGVFKAVNHHTGEMFTAGECCLPGMVESQLSGILETSEGGAEFALDVYAVPAKNAYGYEHRVRSVLEMKESPVIAALEEKMGMLALADKTAAKTELAAKAEPKATRKGGRK